MHGLSSKVSWHRRTRRLSKDISSPFGFVHITHETPGTSEQLIERASVAGEITSRKSENDVSNDDGDCEIHSITSEEERAELTSPTSPTSDFLHPNESISSFGSGSTVQDRDLIQVIRETIHAELEPLNRNIRLMLQGHEGQNCRAWDSTTEAADSLSYRKRSSSLCEGKNYQNNVSKASLLSGRDSGVFLRLPQADGDFPPLPYAYQKIQKGNNGIPPLPSAHRSQRLSIGTETFRPIEEIIKDTDERECLAHALQSHIGEILQSDMKSSAVIEHLSESGEITPDEYQYIQGLAGRNQQLRATLSIIKSRDLDILLIFLDLLHKSVPDIHMSINESFEKNKAEKMHCRKCVVCQLCQSVNIKYLIDTFWGQHLIPDGFYNEVIVTEQPTGAQSKFWERLLDVVNSDCFVTREQARLTLVRILKDKGHYGYIAEKLENQWELGNKRLSCTCSCKEGRGLPTQQPALDSPTSRCGSEPETTSRQSTASLVCAEGIAEELELRLHEIEHESRVRQHPTIPENKH